MSTPTQAQRVLVCTAILTPFIDFEKQYKDENTLVGHIAEGGALWTEAQIMFPDCKWDNLLQLIDFSDGSAIAFIKNPSSTFESMYKAGFV